ncbi:Ank1 [Symbiodinium sp. KB8]|nr:Ank1 [Symbiodinium sp. KB8]
MPLPAFAEKPVQEAEGHVLNAVLPAPSVVAAGSFRERPECMDFGQAQLEQLEVEAIHRSQRFPDSTEELLPLPLPSVSGLNCPLCHKTFEDPVMTVDGHTFCRRCIQDFFMQHASKSGAAPLPNSPVSGQPLLSKLLMPNLAVGKVLTSIRENVRPAWIQVEQEREALRFELQQRSAELLQAYIAKALLLRKCPTEDFVFAGSFTPVCLSSPPRESCDVPKGCAKDKDEKENDDKKTKAVVLRPQTGKKKEEKEDQRPKPEKIDNGEECAPECPEGSQPNVAHLFCAFGQLSPANYSCVPSWEPEDMSACNMSSGCVSRTVRNTSCQRWDVSRPHAFGDPAEVLTPAHNFCGTPMVGDGYGPHGSRLPWCFTNDPGMEWDFCLEPCTEGPWKDRSSHVNGFSSDFAWTCRDYVSRELCTLDGGYGPGWSADAAGKTRHGTFEDYRFMGLTAVDACCGCGGGNRNPGICEDNSHFQDDIGSCAARSIHRIGCDDDWVRWYCPRACGLCSVRTVPHHELKDRCEDDEYNQLSCDLFAVPTAGDKCSFESLTSELRNVLGEKAPASFSESLLESIRKYCPFSCRDCRKCEPGYFMDASKRSYDPEICQAKVSCGLQARLALLVPPTAQLARLGIYANLAPQALTPTVPCSNVCHAPRALQPSLGAQNVRCVHRDGTAAREATGAMHANLVGLRPRMDLRFVNGATLATTVMLGSQCVERPTFASIAFIFTCDFQGILHAVTDVKFVKMGTPSFVDPLIRSNASIMVAILGGMAVSCLQSLNIYRQLEIDWFEPMRSILNAMSVLSFDLDILNGGCILGHDEVRKYTLQQCAVLVIIPLVLITLFCKKRFVATQVRVQFCNTVGTFLQVAFISLVINSVIPLRCFDHPTSGSSVSSMPSILCFAEEGDHMLLLLAGLLSFLLLPCPFLAVSCWATWVYPAKLTDKSPAGRNFQLSTQFLFSRFTPAAHYYCIVSLAKNCLLAFVPVIFQRGVALQSCLLGFAIVLFMMHQLQLHPWKSNIANQMDGFCSASLLLLLLCGTLASPTDASTIREPAASIGASESEVAIALVLGVFLTVGLGYSIYRTHVAYTSCLVRSAASQVPGKHYKWFICHHKADASAQARLLKVLLQAKNSYGNVFIDSDNLVDLDTLFNVVKVQVETLVVYMTRDILTRPWCVGEIVTAFRSSTVQVVRVKTCSYSVPSDEKLNDLEYLQSYIDMRGCNLARYFIRMEDVRDAFANLLRPSTPCVEFNDFLVGTHRFDKLAEELTELSFQRSKGKQKAAFPKDEGNPDVESDDTADLVVISSEPGNDEATAAASILCRKMNAGVAACGTSAICLVDSGRNQFHMANCVARCRALVVLLSFGSLSSIFQLHAIVELMLQLDELGSESKNKPAIIPVNLPEFQFPQAAYYEEQLPVIWGEADLQKAAEKIKSFFRFITINLPIHASDLLIETQCLEVLKRIPEESSASHSAHREPLMQDLAGVIASNRGHFHLLRHGGDVADRDLCNGAFKPLVSLGRTSNGSSESTRLEVIGPDDAGIKLTSSGKCEGKAHPVNDAQSPSVCSGCSYVVELAALDASIRLTNSDSYSYNSSGDESSSAPSMRPMRDLVRLAKAGDLRHVREMLARANPREVATLGTEALHAACSEGHQEIVKMLCAANTKLNAKDQNGLTPLHVAAFRGDDAVVQILCKAKADVHAVDEEGWTPLYVVASFSGQVDVARSLLRAKSDVKFKSANGTSVAAAAQQKGFGDLLQLLKSQSKASCRKGRYVLAGEFMHCFRLQWGDSQAQSHEYSESLPEDLRSSLAVLDPCSRESVEAVRPWIEGREPRPWERTPGLQDLRNTGGRVDGACRSFSECKFEKALCSKEKWLAKEEARHRALWKKQMHYEEMRAKHENKETARRDWQENFTAQKKAEIQIRMQTICGRRQQAQQFIRAQTEEQIASAEAKAIAAVSKSEYIARQRADEEALNQEIASHRDARIANNIYKASLLQTERAKRRLLQQEMTAQRRMMVEQEAVHQRAASAERRRARSDYMDARLRAHSEQLEGKRQEKEARLAHKRQQVEARHQRHEEIMERMRKLDMQHHQTSSLLRELTWQAAVSNSQDRLLHELTAVVPRVASAPTTPRSPGGFTTSPESQSWHTPRRVSADRLVPATPGSPAMLSRRDISPPGSQCQNTPRRANADRSVPETPSSPGRFTRPSPRNISSPASQPGDLLRTVNADRLIPRPLCSTMQTAAKPNLWLFTPGVQPPPPPSPPAVAQVNVGSLARILWSPLHGPGRQPVGIGSVTSSSSIGPLSSFNGGVDGCAVLHGIVSG